MTTVVVKMRVSMLASKKTSPYRKNSLLLLSTLFIVGCQPATDEVSATAPNSENSPIVADAETVTMSQNHILSIKPSRYQPSLGLQGDIEPIKQARLKSAQALIVQQVLVNEGQWVEAGTPLFVVQRQALKQSAQNDEVTDEGTDASTDASTDEGTDRIKVGQPPSSKATTIELITVKAPITGRVDRLNIAAAQQIAANTPLLRLGDDNNLQFIATVPMQAQSQLSVGQNVNFTRKGMNDKFTGQVSELLASDSPDKLKVYVHIIDNEASRGKLKPNVAVNGRVDYGQIEVGTIVPESAIHDVDLSVLKVAPYRPIMPLTANVWIIQQDQRLTRQPVEVIEYDPIADRYLIAGINNDSLICLAELPLKSAGKKVIIS